MSTRSILKQLLDSFFFEIAFYVFVFNCGILNPLHRNKFYGSFKSIQGQRGGVPPIYKSEVDISPRCFKEYEPGKSKVLLCKVKNWAYAMQYPHKLWPQMWYIYVPPFQGPRIRIGCYIQVGLQSRHTILYKNVLLVKIEGPGAG